MREGRWERNKEGEGGKEGGREGWREGGREGGEGWREDEHNEMKEQLLVLLLR